MKIINLAKNTVLANNVVIADTPVKRIKGLLGRREFKSGEALILRPCNSIHTLFMRFAIDVLFIDKYNKVIKTIHNLKPYRLTGIYFGASAVIELPVGTLESS